MAWELGLFGVLIQIPIVRETFGITMPTWPDMAMALGASALVVFAIELTKAYLRMTAGGTAATRSRLIDTGIDFRKTTTGAMETARAPVFDAPVAGFAQQGASIASISQPFAQGNTMRKVLVPVDGSRNCRFAVKHVIRQFMENTAMEIHLLNVQPPFSRYIAQFASKRSRKDYHRDQAEKALSPIKQMLDGFSIPYSVHAEVGEKAKLIANAARRLRCDRIVMSTARKNSLTRLVENSVTNKVIELTTVPVEVIAGEAVSRWERYGIPAGLAAGTALLLAAIE
jgi:nucleotide-binding universal stress UspA family protein